MFETPTVAEELREELARLRADGRERSVRELVDVVGACQSLVNQATAVQMLAMAHVAAIEDVDLEDGSVAEQHRGLGHQRLDAPDLVSEQLGMSAAAASSRMAVALEVVTRVPAVFEAMSAGRLDGYRAGIITEELREAPPQVCAEVVARIEDFLGSEPPASLRRRVRSALAVVDSDLLRAKAARARSERSLRRWPGDEPGVDTWVGSFPAEQARSGWAVVDGLARQYVRDGKVTGLEQARADALMDLIHARATGTFVVQLAVPADQVANLSHRDVAPSAVAIMTGTMSASEGPTDDGPSPSSATNPVITSAMHDDDALVTVAGLGMPGATQVRRGWVESLTTNTRPAGRREVVACHGATGALLAVASSLDRRTRSGRPRATESKAYRPPAALVDLVKARDGRVPVSRLHRQRPFLRRRPRPTVATRPHAGRQPDVPVPPTPPHQAEHSMARPHGSRCHRDLDRPGGQRTHHPAHRLPPAPRPIPRPGPRPAPTASPHAARGRGSTGRPGSTPRPRKTPGPVARPGEPCTGRPSGGALVRVGGRARPRADPRRTSRRQTTGRRRSLRRDAWPMSADRRADRQTQFVHRRPRPRRVLSGSKTVRLQEARRVRSPVLRRDSVTTMASDTASLRSRLSRLWRRGDRSIASTPPASETRVPRPGVPYPGDFTGMPDLDYAPKPDGRPDPGEIVWTWVPYEEDHTQGKDRPVLLVGRDGGWLLGLMLTSKDHDRDHVQEAREGRHWQDIGSGAWDRKGRPSEVRIDRILRVNAAAVRREGAVLDRARFHRVAEAVRAAT